MKQIIIFITMSWFNYFYAEVIYFNNHKFFYQNGESNEILFFLHGGVKNPDVLNGDMDIEQLVGSVELFNLIKEKKWSVVVPVADKKLNWIENTSYCFDVFSEFLQSNNISSYSDITFVGHSDGATAGFSFWTMDISNLFKKYILISGYPQLKYESIIKVQNSNQPIIFVGCRKDKQIPFEFQIDAFTDCVKWGYRCGLLLFEGGHDLNSMSLLNYYQIFEDKGTEYPIHGRVLDNQILEFYSYRRRISRKYNFVLKYIDYNVFQRKQINRSSRSVFPINLDSNLIDNLIKKMD